MNSSYFRFLKVDDFFNGCRDNNFIKSIKSYKVDGNIVLLTVEGSDQQEYKLEIQPVYNFIIRVRFNPAQKGAYDVGNTRTIITDSVNTLKELTGADDINAKVSDATYNERNAVIIDFKYSDSSSMKVVVYKDSFSFDIYKSY
ncbi:MAG: hypothetical protein LBT59_25715, partial [Clostridiales bacterium]|nr:hypothetical protein [Clostridiales bacterium]